MIYARPAGFYNSGVVTRRIDFGIAWLTFLRKACFTSAIMTKQEAIQIFGKTQREMADALGTTKQYISQWPDELTPRQQDWVLGAAYRLGKKIPRRLQNGTAA